MRALGLSEEEYRDICVALAAHQGVDPSKPSAFLFIPFLINLAVGLVLTAAASLLSRPPAQRKPVTVENRAVDGQSVVDGGRLAPKTGFDSVQNVVEMGSPIPLIYANRETISGKTYGGVRVATSLLWQQMLSVGGSQVLRAVHMVGQAPLGDIAAEQCAFGNNLVGSYNLGTTDNQEGRISLYYKKGGGRITTADHLAGRLPAYDIGNAQNQGAPDVFCCRGVNNALGRFHCYSFKPSTQTIFGLYASCGNGLTYRVNPTFRPIAEVRFTQHKDGDQTVRCDDDPQAKIARLKQDYDFGGRFHIVGKSGDYKTVAVGDFIDYHIDYDSDGRIVLRQANSGSDATLSCLDAAQAVASRAKTYDSNLAVGDVYRIGSALAVCISRTEATYVSQVDSVPIGGGQPIDARFRVIAPGTFRYTENVGDPSVNTRWTGTNTSHIHKCAIASFIVDRPCQVIEIGFRSQGGIQFSGLCNFNAVKPYDEIDSLACERFEGDRISGGSNVPTQAFQSGTYTASEERYSFHKLGYRNAGSNGAFTFLSQNFGFRLYGNSPAHNYMRLQFATAEPREFTLIPVSGWEIRAGAVDSTINSGDLEVLDYRSPERTISSGGVMVSYRGRWMQRAENLFELKQGLAPREYQAAGLGYTYTDDDNYVDNWGKLSEDLFVFDEVSAEMSRPEHEITYVNVITENNIYTSGNNVASFASYEGIATVGFTLHSSTEFASADQFSVYVNKGLGATHLFPLVYKDWLLNSDYGAGGLISSLQVDTASFDAAAQWTYDRRYFMDQASATPLNLRTRGKELAGYFLLDLVAKDGRLYLYPLIDFAKPVTKPTYYFSMGNILSQEVTDGDGEEQNESSFLLTYLDQRDRTPPIVVVKWRLEQTSGDASKRGLFPQTRTVTVRETATPTTAPIINIDISDLATSETHAVDLGKITARMARLVTHRVAFKTTPEEASVVLARTFELGIPGLRHEAPPNGFIANDGSVNAWPALADGTYNVKLWNGITGTIDSVGVTIAKGKAVGYRNSIFLLAEVPAPVLTYKTTSLSIDDDGNIDIEGEFWPEAELVKDWTSGFVVEGTAYNYNRPINAIEPDAKRYYQHYTQNVTYVERTYATGALTKIQANGGGYNPNYLPPSWYGYSNTRHLRSLYGGFVETVSLDGYVNRLDWGMFVESKPENYYLGIYPIKFEQGGWMSGHGIYSAIIPGSARMDYGIRFVEEGGYVWDASVGNWVQELKVLWSQEFRGTANRTANEGVYPTVPPGGQYLQRWYLGSFATSVGDSNMGPATDVTPPTVPSSLVVTGNSLTWGLSIDTQQGVKEYRIERYSGVDFDQQYADGWTLLGTIKAPPYVDLTADGAKTYRYRVSATDWAGNISPASSVAVRPGTGGDTSPPSRPGTPTASLITRDSLTLAWSASSDTGGSGIASYVVYQCQVPAGSSSCVATTPVATVTATTANIVGLTPDTSYTFRVRAVDGAGNYANGTPRTVKTLP